MTTLFAQLLQTFMFLLTLGFCFLAGIAYNVHRPDKDLKQEEGFALLLGALLLACVFCITYLVLGELL